MEDLDYNKDACGLDLLTVTSLKNAEANDWLNLETELRKLSLALSSKDKISLVFSKKRLSQLRKTIVWPKDFSSLLENLVEELSNKTDPIFLISKIIRTIWKEYFQSLPYPGYWDYEELIKRLEKTLNFVREKNFKKHFQKILNLVDNHQWPTDLRHQLEDLLDLSYPNDLQQKIMNIVKKLKRQKPLPIF